MRPVLVIPLLVALGPTPGRLEAQRADSLVVGARVRIERLLPERRSVKGFFKSRDSVSFVIGDAKAEETLISMPVREIGGVEVLAGVRTPGEAFRRGAGIGALFGVGVSAILITVGGISDVRNLNCSDCTVSATAVAAVISAAVTVTSIVVGGVAGLSEKERWKRVSFRP